MYQLTIQLKEQKWHSEQVLQLELARARDKCTTEMSLVEFDFEKSQREAELRRLASEAAAAEARAASLQSNALLAAERQRADIGERAQLAAENQRVQLAAEADQLRWRLVAEQQRAEAAQQARLTAEQQAAETEGRALLTVEKLRAEIDRAWLTVEQQRAEIDRARLIVEQQRQDTDRAQLAAEHQRAETEQWAQLAAEQQWAETALEREGVRGAVKVAEQFHKQDEQFRGEWNVQSADQGHMIRDLSSSSSKSQASSLEGVFTAYRSFDARLAVYDAQLRPDAAIVRVDGLDEHVGEKNYRFGEDRQQQMSAMKATLKVARMRFAEKYGYIPAYTSELVKDRPELSHVIHSYRRLKLYGSYSDVPTLFHAVP